jgi:diguanylate cyclase (GGDEF)-like protein
MDKIWEIYENMNEIAYVSDIETNDIVYANRKMRQLFGITSVDEFKGKKCHEIFQNSSLPCAMCNNKRLIPGQYIEWKYRNPVLNRTYAVKDTLVEYHGRKYRLELALDFTTQDEQQEILRNQMNAETIINEGLRLSLSHSTPDNSIYSLLEYVGKSLQSDRIYIFEKREDGRFDNTYEWCANGVIPQIDNLKDIPEEDAEPWMERFRNNENVVITSVADAKHSDPIALKYLVPQEIQSLVTSSLSFNGQVIGFFGVDNPPINIMENISTLLMILGHFIVALLRRRDLHRQLEHRSLYDELTQLGNRHLMDNYIAQLDTSKSIGIVYCDVTGLKEINDTKGHRAGDALLVRASQCLRAAFPRASLFRMGGDEFLVLCCDISQADLLQQVNTLRDIQSDYDVILASGWVWSPNSCEGITTLMAKADDHMYDDKRRYYADHKSAK